MGKLPTQTYQDIDLRTSVELSEHLRNKLKLKNLQAKEAFRQKYPHAEKFLKEKGIELANIRTHSAKLLGTGALAAGLLFNAPSQPLTFPTPSQIVSNLVAKGQLTSLVTPQERLLTALGQVLPKQPQPLDRNTEKALENLFKNEIGVSTKANLEGEHLNTTYGLIGAEQHLYRYPGDTLSQHGSGAVLDEGIAPGLGAWGYFAYSKDKLTPDLEEDEKWYAVVQTLYLPNWNQRARYLINWYKYRKVLIVNTVNGKAVVADVADSGPAAWTGKQFGGSPEVMNYLGGPRYKKGPVVVFFVDDPDNKVPLGPVDYSSTKLADIVGQAI